MLLYAASSAADLLCQQSNQALFSGEDGARYGDRDSWIGPRRRTPNENDWVQVDGANVIVDGGDTVDAAGGLILSSGGSISIFDGGTSRCPDSPSFSGLPRFYFSSIPPHLPTEEILRSRIVLADKNECRSLLLGLFTLYDSDLTDPVYCSGDVRTAAPTNSPVPTISMDPSPSPTQAPTPAPTSMPTEVDQVTVTMEITFTAAGPPSDADKAALRGVLAAELPGTTIKNLEIAYESAPSRRGRKKLLSGGVTWTVSFSVSASLASSGESTPEAFAGSVKTTLEDGIEDAVANDPTLGASVTAVDVSSIETHLATRNPSPSPTLTLPPTAAPTPCSDRLTMCALIDHADSGYCRDDFCPTCLYAHACDASCHLCTDTPVPTPAPSQVPTPEPSLKPSLKPMPLPTGIPSLLPTFKPSPAPSLLPVPEPTGLPTLMPTSRPTGDPSPQPIPQPTLLPTPFSANPTPGPTSCADRASMCHIVTNANSDYCKDEFCPSCPYAHACDHSCDFCDRTPAPTLIPVPASPAPSPFPTTDPSLGPNPSPTPVPIAAPTTQQPSAPVPTCGEAAVGAGSDNDDGDDNATTSVASATWLIIGAVQILTIAAALFAGYRLGLKAGISRTRKQDAGQVTDIEQGRTIPSFRMRFGTPLGTPMDKARKTAKSSKPEPAESAPAIETTPQGNDNAKKKNLKRSASLDRQVSHL